MKKLKLFFACLLMAVLSIGQVWAAEDDTHDFAQTISQSLNNCATISDIVIAEQTYTVKEVIITYAYNKTNGPTFSVSVGDGDWGTTELSKTTNLTTYTTMSFSGDAVKGAVTVSFTNNNCTGTGKGTVNITNVRLVEGPAGGGSDKCSTPSISPAACSFYGSQQVTITCATEDAAIYYTIDESIPSSSNGTLYPGSAITVSGATTTVKAIAIKDGLDDSDVASVTYTYAGAAVSGYAIDFESDLVAYVDWEFTNLALRTSSNNGVTPHSGTYYAANATSSSATSGTASAIITTKDKVAKPGVLTFYISKESNNTSASSWVAQVSEDGDTWTDVETFDAKSMSKGSWNECVADLSEYTNVYVRISYGSSTALRAIDDINLEMASAVNKPIISGDDNFYPTTTVTLTQAAADAIYYTTNGDAPTTGSTLYEDPFELNATATVKAIAIKDEVASAVAEKTFTKIVPWSVAEANEQLAISTPQNGKYVRGIISQIDGYSSNAITYWISDDGSTTDQLEVYKGKGLNNTNFSAITDLSLGEVVVVYGNLKVFEPSSGGSINEFDAGNYLISKEAPAVAAPVFSPDGGGFMGETDVTITCETAGSAIYYTLDGTTPSKSSTPYTAAIHLDATTTITAVAYVGDDASLVIAKAFTLSAPMTVAEALTALDTENPINNAAVSGIISTAPSSNPSSGRLTYYISDDGSTTSQLKVYNGYGLNGASFSNKTDLQEGDEVTVFGNLTIYSETKEFDAGNRLLAFNRPVVPSISADPVAVDAAAHDGQSVTITYNNWGAVSVADAEATLWDNEACDEAFSGDWIENVSVAANFESVSFDIAANTGEARTAYMKIYALGDDATTEAEKVIAISQEAYVAPALPAELPFAFDGGKADIASKQGMSQDGLDNSDYASSPKLKFKAEGAWVIIEIASAPGKLTYDIIGNSFSGGTFKVQQSADGVDYTDVATYTELGAKASEEKTLLQATRFVKFIYTTKDAGNVALGNIAIAAPVAVETPTFSPAGGEYEGEQTVTISCETGGATIYYTTNGDDPDNTKTLYEGAITVDESKTIKAIAYKGEDHSEIATATYTITPALTDYYEKVESGDVAEGTYLIVYEAGSLAFDGGADPLDAVENSIAVDIVSGNKIGVTSATEAATFYIDPTAGTIQAASGKYIGQTSDANGLGTSESASTYTNSFSFDEGNAVIVSSSAHLCYNSASNQLRFRYYKSSSYSSQQPIALYKLANEVIKPASGLAWDPAEDITLTVGDAFTAPTLLNPKEIPAGDITIASSNTSLATVSAGVVSLVANATGTTTITATYTGETYKPITVSYKIKVNPVSSIVVSPSLYVNFGSVEKDATLPADKTITVTLNNVATATATLAGDDVFDIDKTALAEGENVITISVASTATTGEFSATITITDDAAENPAAPKTVNLSFKVTAPAGEETPVGTDTKWVPATEIVDGMQVLIVGVNNTDYYAMGAQANNGTGNNRLAVPASVNEGVLTPGENTMAFTVVEQPDGSYALQTSNDKYLYAASSSSNYLKTKDELDDNGKWTLSVTSAVANGTYTHKMMQFNSSSSIFACYTTSTTTQKPIALYVEQTPEPPTPSYETVRTGLEVNRHYTVCLEKNITAIDGATFWNLQYKNAGNTEVYLVEETAPEAGKPYIIQATKTTLKVVYGTETESDPVENGALRGTFTGIDEVAFAALSGDVYLLISNAIRPRTTGNYLDAHRAYVLYDALDEVPAAGFAPGKQVKSMPMQRDAAQGFENIESGDAPMKVMIEGTLYILRGEKVYDATGRLVK